MLWFDYNMSHHKVTWELGASELELIPTWPQILPVNNIPPCFPFDPVIHSRVSGVRDISLLPHYWIFYCGFFFFSSQKHPLFGTYYSLHHPYFESVTKSPETAARMTHELHCKYYCCFFFFCVIHIYVRIYLLLYIICGVYMYLLFFYSPRIII